MGVIASLRRLLTTRKCRACGERYPRRLPNCPVCKTLPGYDGIERGPNSGAGAPPPGWGGA